MEKTEITVIDCAPSSGKTNYVTNLINSEKGNWIFITPILDETSRIQDSCLDINFIAPEVDKDDKTKRESFIRLLKNEESIVTTHSLFREADEELLSLIKSGGYRCVLDEELTVSTPLNMDKKRVNKLFKDFEINDNFDNIEIKDNGKTTNVIRGSSKLLIDDDGRVYKNPKLDYDDIDSLDRAILDSIDKGVLYCHDKEFFIWIVKKELFDVFEKCYVLSYMVQDSFLHSYFSKQGIICNFIKPLKEEENEVRRLAKSLIKIADIPAFEKGAVSKYLSMEYAMSHTSLTNGRASKELKKKIVSAESNWLKKMNFKSNDILSTTYKDLKHVGGKGNYYGVGIPSYMNTWKYIGLRATNELSYKKCVVYNCLMSPHPGILNFLNKDNDVKISIEKFQLSYLLQFLYRGCVRKNKSIWVIIPNKRLRDILIFWMNGGTVEEFLSKEKTNKEVISLKEVVKNS